MIKKLWNSATFQGLLEDPKVNKLRKPWLFDLRKLAWSTAKVQELRCRVNIDEERGRPDKEENMFNIVIRPTGTIRLNSLRSYLQGESDWNNHVLECMSKYETQPPVVLIIQKLTYCRLS
jgi:eukaryotic translation initiation factor 2C